MHTRSSMCSNDKKGQKERRGRRSWFFSVFRAKIREEMKKQDLSLTEFAKSLDKNKSTVSRALNSDLDIKLSTLFLMAEKLGKEWHVDLGECHAPKIPAQFTSNIACQELEKENLLYDTEIFQNVLLKNDSREENQLKTMILSPA